MTEAASSDRPGHHFQNFIAMLERTLAYRDGVKVDSPLRLRDKDTGRLREHDVVITRTTHHGPSLTAIECKDHGRKVGVPEIEAFSKKCEKTGIHRAIMVAAKGFTRTALTKAKALNLTCMVLAEAEVFEWIGDVTLISRVFQFIRIEISVRVRDHGSKLTGTSIIHDSSGVPYSGEDAQSVIMRKLPSEAVTPTNGLARIGQIVVPGDGFYVLDITGKRYEVEDITFGYALEINETMQPIILHNYASDEARTEIASGQIVFPGGQALMVLSKTAEGVVAHVHSTGTSDHRLTL